MIWINKFLLFMSLSGSVALLLYYFIKGVFGRYISAGCQYLLLKICMCFYLLPVPLLSEEIRTRIRNLFPDFSYGLAPVEVWITDYSNIIHDTPEGYALPGFSRIAMLLSVAWLVIVAGILVIQCRKYRKITRLTKHTPKASGQLNEISRQMQNKMKLHRRITLYTLDEKFPPFCYGFFNPRIIIPSEYGAEETKLILWHELQHIKSLDFLFRIAAFLIVALHFFNPLAYLLSYEIGKASEFACDEKVLEGCSEKERQKYGVLLLDAAVSSPILSYTNSFSGNNAKTMKERITMMKHPRKTKTILFICCAMLVAFFSTLSVAAYELPKVEESDYFGKDVVSQSYMFSTETPAQYVDPIEAYFSKSDTFFIDEEGNLVFDLADTSISTQSSCSHTYVSGYLHEHKLNSSGGCTYTIYTIKRCSKCGATKDKTLYRNSIYTVCPH